MDSSTKTFNELRDHLPITLAIDKNCNEDFVNEVEEVEEDMEREADEELNVLIEKKDMGIPSVGSLLRLFQCELFDVHMNMHYLFKNNKPGVQSYLGEWL